MDGWTDRLIDIWMSGFVTWTRASLYASFSGQCHIYMDPITAKDSSRQD